MFGVAENKIELWKTLENIKWNGRQPFEEYCFLKKLVAQKLKISEMELVEYVVEGIADDVIRNQARMQNFKTMADVLQAFRLIRRSDVQCSRRSSIICYACNQEGHKAVDCFNRRYENRKHQTRPMKYSNNETIKETVVNIVSTKDSILTNRPLEKLEGKDGLIDFKFLNNNCNFKGLFDTGSPISLIRRGLVEKKRY